MKGGLQDPFRWNHMNAMLAMQQMDLGDTPEFREILTVSPPDYDRERLSEWRDWWSSKKAELGEWAPKNEEPGIRKSSQQQDSAVGAHDSWIIVGVVVLLIGGLVWRFVGYWRRRQRS